MHQSAAGLKQEMRQLLDKLNIPQRPKKPLTPYFKFLSQYRETVKKDNPGLKITEIAKKCSAVWKSLPDSEKVNYEKQYKEELEGYTSKYLAYESQLTPEQRSALQIAKEEKLKENKKRKLRKVFCILENSN